MKTYLLFIVILIIYSQSIALSQNNIVNRNPVNQIDLDIEFLGLGISYKRKVFKKNAIGCRLEGGAILRAGIIDRNEAFYDWLKPTIFIDIPLNNKIHIQPGVSYSAIFYSFDDDNSGVAISMETGIFFKVWRIELGLTPSIIFYNDDDWFFEFSSLGHEFEYRGIITTLIIIKIPIVKW